MDRSFEAYQEALNNWHYPEIPPAPPFPASEAVNQWFGKSIPELIRD